MFGGYKYNQFPYQIDKSKKLFEKVKNSKLKEFDRQKT